MRERIKQIWNRISPYILTYSVAIAIPLAVGIASAALTRGNMDVYEKLNTPPLSPPGILFPIVWTILYLLMGISAARVSLTPPSRERSRGLNLFVAQLIVNFFWSPIFFNAQAYGFALLWLLLLWVLVGLMILSFRKTDPAASLLQIPYLIWLTFAAYLNAGVWYLNK